MTATTDAQNKAVGEMLLVKIATLVNTRTTIKNSIESKDVLAEMAAVQFQNEVLDELCQFAAQYDLSGLAHYLCGKWKDGTA